MGISEKHADVVLIGAGIMSATLGLLLNRLQPDWSIEIYETLDQVAGESSAAWNNAGTGHSALCELNYTPQLPDGSMDISKALNITESFEVSRQFWATLVTQGVIPAPGSFIHSVPHMSFVWGDENTSYLRKRYEAMVRHHFYKKMQYSSDRQQLEQWIPLVMHGRDSGQKVAATKIDIGTDVNYGALTNALLTSLCQHKGVALHLNHEVHNLHREPGGWLLKVKDKLTHAEKEIHAKFVFIGAGGGALPLLEKAHMPEARGFGGFPVSGQWLRCTNNEIVARHHAKVYGKASVGTPPMSVPHLDTRVIDGKNELLFGPFAGFTTKFLKQGSYLDLPLSLRASNIIPMVAAGLHNIPLTEYLVHQARQSPRDRINALKEYYPDASINDWELKIAGQRVQVIKKDKHQVGVLEFGTEVINATDGSIAALLGASPGASTSVSIMLGLLKNCFKDKMDSSGWQSVLKSLIPSYGQSLADNEALCDQVRAWTSEVLALESVK